MWAGQQRTGEHAVENAEAAAAVRVLRGAVVALLPSLVAFPIERALFDSTGSRWLLMIAAVIVSAANGGMAAGLIATITSAALVWCFLVPPLETLGAVQPIYYFSVVVFIAIGFAVTLLHERLRRTTDRLAHLARQNQIFAALIENSVD